MFSSPRWRASALALLALVALLPSGAAAWERLDHRDQSALTITPGFEHLILAGRGDERSVSEPGFFTDLSWGLPGGREGGQGLFGLRVGAGPDEGARLLAPYLGYRSFAGDDEWKTFFDAGAFGRILPVWGLGVRLGAGLQYELSQNAGVFFSTGGSVGFGQGLQVAFDAGIGLQLRFGVPGGAGIEVW